MNKLAAIPSLGHNRRKTEHIDISINQDVSFKKTSAGFDAFHLIHEALPEIDFDDVSMGTSFLRHSLKLPLLISSMVGGIEEAGLMNRRLAEAAEEMGCAMGVGSQRCAVEDPELGETFDVKKYAPGIFLASNLGAVQLNYSYGIDECRKSVEMIDADALILHLNPLQEVIQPEGNRNFKNLADKIHAVCSSLHVPVIVKEVGSGISKRTAALLCEAGVAAIDTAGAGGTSWSEVERYRQKDPLGRRVAGEFSEWGIPTVKSLENIKAADPEMITIASGGVRNGIDVAKAVALGASIAGMAMPFLEASRISTEAVIDEIEVIKAALQTAMFCSGVSNIDELRGGSQFLQREEHNELFTS